MTEIKSVKAREFIESTRGIKPIYERDCIKAVVIAETEAGERHIKEMQELKDRVIDAMKDKADLSFMKTCPQYKSCALRGTYKCYCETYKKFIQKINEL